MATQSLDELRAELDVLRRRLSRLEAEQPNLADGAPARRRPRSTLVALTLLGVLAAGGVLYGEVSPSALFIDTSGRVGVGVADPGATLDVKDTLNVRGASTLKQATVVDTLNVQGAATLKATTVVEGAATIKGGLTMDDKRQIIFKDVGTIVTDPNSGTMVYVANGWHSWRDDQGERMALRPGPDGGLTVSGTGTSKFVGKLEVDGGLLVKPVVEQDNVGTLPLRISWPGQAQGQPTSKTMPLDPYCADADGCRIRMRMETFDSAIAFSMFEFLVAVSSPGPGARQVFFTSADATGGNKGCYLKDGCGLTYFGDQYLRVSAKDTDLTFATKDGRSGLDVTVYDH